MNKTIYTPKTLRAEANLAVASYARDLAIRAKCLGYELHIYPQGVHLLAFGEIIRTGARFTVNVAI